MGFGWCFNLCNSLKKVSFSLATETSVWAQHSPSILGNSALANAINGVLLPAGNILIHSRAFQVILDGGISERDILGMNPRAALQQ